MATPKQIKAAKLLSENLGSKNPKTIEEVLLEVPYSESVSRQQSSVMEGIRPLLDPFVQKLLNHRSKVVDRMEKLLPETKYSELTHSFDILTKNTQLLQGKTTENTVVLLTGDLDKVHSLFQDDKED